MATGYSGSTAKTCANEQVIFHLKGDNKKILSSISPYGIDCPPNNGLALAWQGINEQEEKVQVNMEPSRAPLRLLRPRHGSRKSCDTTFSEFRQPRKGRSCCTSEKDGTPQMQDPHKGQLTAHLLDAARKYVCRFATEEDDEDMVQS